MVRPSSSLRNRICPVASREISLQMLADIHGRSEGGILSDTTVYLRAGISSTIENNRAKSRFNVSKQFRRTTDLQFHERISRSERC